MGPLIVCGGEMGQESDIAGANYGFSVSTARETGIVLPSGGAGRGNHPSRLSGTTT